MEKILIRRARRADVVELSLLIREVIRTTKYYSASARKTEVLKYTSVQVAKFLEKKGSRGWVALVRNEVVGFLIGSGDAETAWLEWLGVGRAHRGKGVATQLMLWAEGDLKKRGETSVCCDSRTDNMESIGLLRQLKYRKVGTLPKHFYGQDFFIWQKHLD